MKMNRPEPRPYKEYGVMEKDELTEVLARAAHVVELAHSMGHQLKREFDLDKDIGVSAVGDPIVIGSLGGFIFVLPEPISRSIPIKERAMAMVRYLNWKCERKVTLFCTFGDEQTETGPAPEKEPPL